MKRAFDEQILSLLGGGSMSQVEIAESLGVDVAQRARIAPNLKRLILSGMVVKTDLSGTVAAKRRNGGRYVVYSVVPEGK